MLIAVVAVTASIRSSPAWFCRRHGRPKPLGVEHQGLFLDRLQIVEEIVCLITSFVEGLTFPLDLSGYGMGRRTTLFRSYVHDAEMAVNLSTAPSDEDIAILWPHTLHSRWGQEGFMGGISTKGDDFVSRCSMCGKNRRDCWEKEPY